jgi:hypothetical protein
MMVFNQWKTTSIYMTHAQRLYMGGKAKHVPRQSGIAA